MKTDQLVEGTLGPISYRSQGSLQVKCLGLAGKRKYSVCVVEIYKNIDLCGYHELRHYLPYSVRIKKYYKSTEYFGTMSWDCVEVGLAGGEETVSFGPRHETGSSLYQVDTLANISPREKVRYIK